MADRPIIFSGPMILALLAGTKSQTRRLVKPQPELNSAGLWVWPPDWRTGIPRYGVGVQTDAESLRETLEADPGKRLSYAVGDRLWVREAHAFVPSSAYRQSEGVDQARDPSDRDMAAIYRAGFDRSSGGIRWRPSIYCPRWASRLTLTVTDVRVQRLGEISCADAIAEGIPAAANSQTIDCDTPDPRLAYRRLWESLHGAGSWATNPWVSVITFETRQGNIDD